MRTKLPRVISRVGGAVLAGAVVALMAATPPAAQAVTDGVECETPTSASGTAESYMLTAKSGYVFTPDGNSIFMWGYAGSTGSFQLPGPTLCVTAGRTVSVTLKNTLPDPVSIVFPGQQQVTADGQADAANLAASPPTLAKPAARTSGTVTYTFVPDKPGTYLYESGTDQRKQVQMGLFGGLVVRPANYATGGADAHSAYGTAATRFGEGQEYLHILSEVDPAVHLAVEKNRVVNWAGYRPRYFMINGRSMPDTLAPNRASYLPAQPYSAFVHVQPFDPNANPAPAIIRYVNVGTVTYPFHPHGNSQRVVGRDGRRLQDGAADLSYDKFLVNVGPGQTVDTLFSWTDVDMFDPIDNSLAEFVPNQADVMTTGDTFYSQSPYLGSYADPIQGVTSYNVCGEYYHVAHSHALQQSTNYGAAMGGMMTLIRIDPPSALQTVDKPCN
ncbi:multicopper oxidase domain-containing protein [Kineosporia sp. A_224]|uniref:multicopper oxidase domain-containing protein n=1 Tax=Kineosporia sp. A_224 TaxID=1962180 RepID=UPI000B4AEA4B|nr:multicopper oxidase domain-containing protein [Kineosporia sp. A_224]